MNTPKVMDSLWRRDSELEKSSYIIFKFHLQPPLDVNHQPFLSFPRFQGRPDDVEALTWFSSPQSSWLLRPHEGRRLGCCWPSKLLRCLPNIGGRVLIVGGGGSKCVKFYIFFCWKSWIVYLLFNWIVYDFSNFLAAVFFWAFKTGYVTLKCFFLEGPETGMTGSKPSTKIARLKWRGQRNFWEARGNGSLWNSKLWRALKGETFEFFG